MRLAKEGRKIVAKIYPRTEERKRFYGENLFSLEFPKMSMQKYCKDQKEVDHYLKKYYPNAKIK